MRPVLDEILSQAERKTKAVCRQMALLKWMAQAENNEETMRQALAWEESCERLALLARSLPVYTGCSRAKEESLRVTKTVVPVAIGFTAEKWFCVRLPLLLPKKESGSADYIRSFLYPAMRDFFDGRPPVRYRDCVLIYRHVYDRRRPERQMRDHDNIEMNMVTDIVAMYVMPDDGPSVCSHYYCSAAAETERTEVYIVPRAEFPVWLFCERKMPEEGVELYETQQEA